MILGKSKWVRGPYNCPGFLPRDILYRKREPSQNRLAWAEMVRLDI